MLLEWFRNFLLNRKQRVWVGQSLSREAPLHSGVLQVSILGPLLFLVFILDMEEDVEDVSISILKYVDDFKIIGQVRDHDDIVKNEESLDKMYYWADKNNMKLTP